MPIPVPRVTLHGTMKQATDFGDVDFPSALVNVTNACNLSCSHCFVFRADNPNRPQDKMDDATMLAQLEELRDKHNIRRMLFMGGEPMIRRDLVLEAMQLFEESAIVTNGTYGIPSVPGHLVTVSLDGPKAMSDAIRGEGVFDQVRDAIHERDPEDGTHLMLQMTITRTNEAGIEDFVDEVKDWPITGLAFTFYVPTQNDSSGLGWPDLRDRDPIVERVIELKLRHPWLIKSNVGALRLMHSSVSLESTGTRGENCLMRNTLPLYMGDGGNFERTFCCYGNNVDCTRCGAYSVFNAEFQRRRMADEVG